MDYKRSITIQGKDYHYFSLKALAEDKGIGLSRFPYSLRILLENVLRQYALGQVTFQEVESLLAWPETAGEKEIPFMPGRVIMQDFTGVPGVVDLAAMRSCMERLKKDPRKINPVVPTALVIDHSVQIDTYGTDDALMKNMEREYQRNSERYALLKWAQESFKDFKVIPPGKGIIHQVNLEHLAKLVWEKDGFLYPDTLVGTDSHTTMINGLGVVGWGVGGIEAEAVMLGQPYYMVIPEVVGVKLVGTLPEGATATDLVLTITELLRKHKVVGKFVEFFGPGYQKLTLPDRATIANMAPEYGATMGFCPADRETLNYLAFTGRDRLIPRVEAYLKGQSLLYEGDEPQYTDVLTLNLGDIEPSMAGPRLPQQRVPLTQVKAKFQEHLTSLKPSEGASTPAQVTLQGGNFMLKDGSIVIAAITSCTNTSNPHVLFGAGLLAKKAVEKGLTTKPWVKTSLAPGSRVVTDYLEKAGLMPYLKALGFHVVGYGCTTCIGNSGPLHPVIQDAIDSHGLVVASVLSGNRNFEARVHTKVRANYLASPILVVAYALAGRMDIDLTKEPLGYTPNGEPVYLKDLLPSSEEIRQAVEKGLDPETFKAKYSQVTQGDHHWDSLPITQGELFPWSSDSTYIQEPPFFKDFEVEPPALQDITGARVLALLGDGVTTDHISPAGRFSPDTPAGKYLMEKGVKPEDFNTYGSRRGNHEVMMRGTFANVRLKNQLVPGTEGGWTLYHLTGEKMAIYDAAMAYQKAGIPLLVIGGKEYGTGSSRDWAAKGTLLLGVSAVLAESYERIHRSNLVSMGVLPLEFLPGESAQTLGLTGKEIYHIQGIQEGLTPKKKLTVKVENGEETKSFEVICRLDTPQEVAYYHHGGILPYVLRRFIKES